jgi:hypothetical protein
MHLHGSEPQVSLINKGIVPVGVVVRGRITTEEGGGEVENEKNF